jgi:hypothetical protein
MRHGLTFTLLCVFALAVTALPAHAQGYLFNQLSGSTSILPNLESFAIAQGDFNGDGRTDFAVNDDWTCDLGNGNQQCFYVQVYLAQSNGTYALANNYLVPGDGSYPNGANYTITTGDVNGDGKIDLVYSGIFGPSVGYPNYLFVQLGNGDGTFQTPIATLTPAFQPQSVALGDFNGDHKMDLVIADSGTLNTIYVHFGNGDGTFQPGVAFTVQGDPAQVIVADFNNDKKLDLAVACAYGSPTGTNVLLGNGDGTFAPAAYYAVGGSGVAAADMNKDGIPDLLVSGPPNNGLSVMLGIGDGTFQSPIMTSLGGNIFGNLVTGDFNGDGKMDVAMASAWTGIAVLFGNNNGTFQTPVFAYGNTEAEFFPSIVAGDYNLDGKLDMATASYVATGEPFFVLSNNGDGTFGSYGSGADLTAKFVLESVVSADLNKDGLQDLVVTASNNSAMVYLGKAGGTFQPPKSYKTGLNPLGAVIADFNKDGDPDLAVADNTASKVSVLLGKGDGTFNPQVSYTTGKAPSAIAYGDFNKDGNLDLVVGDTGDANVTVLLGKGDGTFQSAKRWPTGAIDNTGVVVADFNRDGNPDIAVSVEDLTVGPVAILLGNGDGTFQAPTYFSNTPGAYTTIAAGDLRNAGFTDLVVFSGSSFLAFLGNGDGTFTGPVSSSGGVGDVITLQDMNGDGRLDIVATGYNSAVGISIGNGDGTFQPQIMYSVPRTDANEYATGVAVADFNGDGAPDIAVTTMAGTAGNLTVFLSNPVPAFSNNPLKFGQVPVGSTSTLVLTVTNQSTVKLSVTGITISGTAASNYSQTNNCSSVLPFANCAITVTFKPSAKGARNATLNFSSKAAGKARTVSLTGTGK